MSDIFNMMKSGYRVKKSVPATLNLSLNLNLLCLPLQVFMSRHFLYNCSQPILDVKIAFCQVCVPYR